MSMETTKQSSISANVNVKDGFEASRTVSKDYPIPEFFFRKKYLPRNYKCPVSYKKTFQGVYGIINYEIYGDISNPLLLCFHGMNASIRTFDKLGQIMQYLNTCLITFDLYGHGLSQVPKRSSIHQMFTIIDRLRGKPKYHSTDFYVAQAREVVEHLNLKDRTLSVLGFSMGGVIASRYVELNADKVNRLVLVSSAGYINDKTKKGLVSVLKLFQFCIPLISIFLRPMFYKRKRVVSKLVKHGWNDSTANNIYNYQFWQFFVKKKQLQTTFGSIVGIPLLDSRKIFKKVGRLNIPVLVLCGGNDKVIPIESSKAVASYFKNSHLIVFPAGSHLIIMNSSVVWWMSIIITIFLNLPATYEKSEWSNVFPVQIAGRKINVEKRQKIADQLNVDLSIVEKFLENGKHVSFHVVH